MLKLLTDSGIARKLEVGDGLTMYEANFGKKHHGHLICEKYTGLIPGRDNDRLGVAVAYAHNSSHFKQWMWEQDTALHRLHRLTQIIKKYKKNLRNLCNLWASFFFIVFGYRRGRIDGCCLLDFFYILLATAGKSPGTVGT